jgi:hypothetical protein
MNFDHFLNLECRTSRQLLDARDKFERGEPV